MFHRRQGAVGAVGYAGHDSGITSRQSPLFLQTLLLVRTQASSSLFAM
jgi:hypothetical protein